MSSSSLFSCLLFFFFIIFCSSSLVTVEAKVPVAKAFKSVNQGLLLSGYVEYNANYRLLGISNYPFRLCFYNSTPNAYFLGLGMGNASSTSVMRWVWTANRSRPVTDKAKLIFTRNGNLVLVDADGRVAWQTNTANKGVLNIKLLPDGNLVLLNKTGGFVWQSFDYPTDTLLIGQSLIPGQSLVNGAYSMVVSQIDVALYFKNPLSSKTLPYYTITTSGGSEGLIIRLIFRLAPDFEGPEHANEIRLDTIDYNNQGNTLVTTKYNSTLSIFRLGSNGNIHVYTYYEKGVAWEETYTVFTNFDEGTVYNDVCMLPEKCGSFGLCENSNCIACPTPKGLEAWSKDCKPIRKHQGSCNVSDPNAISYYKLNAAGIFLDESDLSAMTIEECKKKCSNDCKCVVFAYRGYWGSCALVNEISYTLMSTSAEYSSIYIKYTK